MNDGERERDVCEDFVLCSLINNNVSDTKLQMLLTSKCNVFITVTVLSVLFQIVKTFHN